MSYLEKYSKYKSKYLDFKNQFGGAITCTTQIVGDNGIDVLIHDNNLPGDLRSSMENASSSSDSFIAFFSWFPDYKNLNDHVRWTITSNSYDQMNEKLLQRSLQNSKWMYDDRLLFWNEIELKESTELQLYKNKYDKLFRIMAINELYKVIEFQEWAKTHSF